jgi:mannose-1-phosphate guanylyltransferase
MKGKPQLKGIIIAGGLGTRLRPLTYHRPKPLVQVVNRPFLEYQVALLREHGIDDIVFATNYMADKIQGHFGDGSRFGVKMRYAVEDTPLGTGGAIRNAADLFPGEDVAVFNGDVLTDYDLKAVIDFHYSKKAIATITLQPVPSPNPFGVLVLNEDDRVTAWLEPSEETKKALASDQNVAITGTDMINAGFYVLDSRFISAIPHGEKCSIERDIFPRLLAEQAPVYGCAPGGFWMDLGRAEQLMAATRAILDGSVATFTTDVAIAPTATVSEHALISGLTSIGAGSTVGKNSTLTDCIIMENVRIGANVNLSHLIVDEHTIIEDDVIVEGKLGGATPVIAANSCFRQGTRALHS